MPEKTEVNPRVIEILNELLNNDNYFQIVEKLDVHCNSLTPIWGLIEEQTSIVRSLK